ncbi:MAG TPA: FKBP-type peptidyl-prolyl cis-trans isomerase [Candidatus Limnocylindrales bacterium]|nr:FKBP-type peptidyl-prolyl cis-trans isomerase [Candidatus Limnocylindrales bacterium]
MIKDILIMIVIGIIFLGTVLFFSLRVSSKPNIGTSNTSTPETANTADAPQVEVKIPDNLKIDDSVEGTGPAVKSGDTITIHYAGRLEDGTPFDSSYDRGEPFTTQIGVGQVIKGWDLGVVGMKVGGKRKLTIPPDLGYGDQDQGKIPPNSTLIFDVELMEIK